MSTSLTQIVAEARNDDALAERVRELYAELDASIAAKAPTCWNKGECCHFGKYGHRLYVTTPELAYFVRGQESSWLPPTSEASCPYQKEGRCTAREHRPMGCRVFHCDPAAKEWQGPVTENFLARIRELGDEFGVEYRYVEWLSALREWSETVESGQDSLT